MDSPFSGWAEIATQQLVGDGWTARPVRALIGFLLDGAGPEPVELAARTLAANVHTLLDQLDGLLAVVGAGLEKFGGALEELANELTLPVGPRVSRAGPNVGEGQQVEVPQIRAIATENSPVGPQPKTTTFLRDTSATIVA